MGKESNFFPSQNAVFFLLSSQKCCCGCQLCISLSFLQKMFFLLLVKMQILLPLHMQIFVSVVLFLKNITKQKLKMSWYIFKITKNAHVKQQAVFGVAMKPQAVRNVPDYNFGHCCLRTCTWGSFFLPLFYFHENHTSNRTNETGQFSSMASVWEVITAEGSF